MKIGIMSMQRVRNYGSFLQAYGLKYIIEKLGHEVIFLDYKVEKPIVPYKERNIIYKLLSSFYHGIKKNIFKEEKMRYLYDAKYLPMLGVSKKKKYRSNVDVLVIGSDEVFNCLQSGINIGFSRELFGKDNNANKVISYAASFGYTTLNGLRKYRIDNEIGKLLKGFMAISVRDANSSSIVKELTGKEPIINVDPVIIADFDEHINLNISIEDYILIYAYTNRINKNSEITAIKNFAKKYNKKLVSVGIHQDWTDIKLEADPFELLSYVKGADYLITDTFHGSIFSIKYNKPFATIIRESNKQKLRDLLKRFNVSDREVSNMEDLENVLLKPIDFEDVNNIIKIETDRSIAYLKEQFEN